MLAFRYRKDCVIGTYRIKAGAKAKARLITNNKTSILDTIHFLLLHVKSPFINIINDFDRGVARRTDQTRFRLFLCLSMQLYSFSSRCRFRPATCWWTQLGIDRDVSIDGADRWRRFGRRVGPVLLCLDSYQQLDRLCTDHGIRDGPSQAFSTDDLATMSVVHHELDQKTQLVCTNFAITAQKNYAYIYIVFIWINLTVTTLSL